jgi:hypothetical protein
MGRRWVAGRGSAEKSFSARYYFLAGDFFSGVFFAGTFAMIGSVAPEKVFRPTTV